MSKRHDIELVALKLSAMVFSDYTTRILDNIIDDIVSDVEECADTENWNEDDVRLAIGRVLMKRLNIEE